MKITKAIPEKYNKSYLTEAEREELLAFKDKVMDEADFDQIELDKIEHAKSREKRKVDVALKQLEEIDRKTIRALRENNLKRLSGLEKEAIELRKKLK